MIHLEKISKEYSDGDIRVIALNDVSLTIEQGEFVAVMGPSGSGKSTLMNILGCLDVPSSGVYRLNDRQINNLTAIELAALRNQTIGFIFQTFHLLPRLSVLKNVELPMLYRGVRQRERRQRAIELLKMVGLEERLHHQPNQLSGGQKQRVAIARALANNPSIILADEPTGNLDTNTSIEIMNILTDLNKQGVTIVLVTHEEDIALFASRIIRFRDGQIVEDSLVS
ncbi:macrolide ABC transporter ATP-binding protein [Vulcanibacillus modesticaldus]|uniref:Macrolide ABC transporter ATP-binding protein n=1 Tax=Vulcanibacillus modesticaldus TaxID=337097 RepID=A0A1D2YV37_9BACI|nr:ABC transporter ATP-binding protein [Vulcanibacillus modesticaldus]OEF99543.1 macrolide ABC transporter ATP-binding protein [Vulcanibacillus modesticaldus]